MKTTTSSKPASKKLTLTRETVKTLRTKSGVRTGSYKVGGTGGYTAYTNCTC